METNASLLNFSIPEYLVSLARALAGDASLSKDERVLLANSNYQLLAIGRNLNQVARMLNSEQALGPGDFDGIEDAVLATKKHVKVVADFLAAVRARWVIADEDR